MDNPKKHIINACDPLAPATHEQYVDCSFARGSSSFVEDACERFKSATNPVIELFSGHIGCGKSSELRRLYNKLKHHVPTPDSPRFFPVFLQAEEYLNFNDVALTDVLLAIAAQLGETLMAEQEVSLTDNPLTKMVRELWDALNAPLTITKADLSLSSLKFAIEPLPRDENARQRIQEALRPRLTRLQDELNFAFDKGLAELNTRMQSRKMPLYDRIVVIVDSLDRIRGVKGCDTAEKSWRELFVDNAPTLTSFNAHMVYTIPLRLVRSTTDNMASNYGNPAEVLPMVTVEKRDRSGPYSGGFECLREILAKRAAPLPLTGEGGVFTEEAIDFLLKYCGGHPRYLLSYVVESALKSSTLPITLDTAKKGVVPTVRDFSPAIPPAYYDKLVRVYRDPRRQMDTQDEDDRRMLERNWILEYVNGGDSDDPFTATTQWYGVHPIISELPQFKDALNRMSAVQ